MLEVKAWTHINRYFATTLRVSDLFLPVQYLSYRGPVEEIPCYYFVTKAHSCYSDLSVDMDTILKSMKSNTRNEIRRAIKEGCEFNIVNDVDNFISFYNDFCASKNLNDYTSRNSISKYKNVLITSASLKGEVLAMHANVFDSEHGVAFLMFSCSKRLDCNVDKKLIGWANRFLHFKDLEYLKQNGCLHYDWSGVCIDPNDERYTIGQFKLAFGGKLIESIVLRTPLFAMLEYVRDVMCWLRK